MGRPNFAASVEQNRNRPAVRVIPSLVSYGWSWVLPRLPARRRAFATLWEVLSRHELVGGRPSSVVPFVLSRISDHGPKITQRTHLRG